MQELKTMTEKGKGKVAPVSQTGAKTKSQKAADRADRKATKATEEMHRIVTASLEELQHPGAGAQNVSHDLKTGVRKAVAGAKKAPHKAGSK
jgi:uncharacterized phage infection (PIP) family protein YhgE